MKPIYLDHSATTPVRKEVVDAMMPFFSDTFGNASSVHTFGQNAKRALEDAREVVADCIGADAMEIYFTSGGTESDNLAIKGVARACVKKGRHIITSQIEHHAVLNTCKYMEKEDFEVTCVPADQYGVVDVDALAKAVRKDTILVTVMQANNEVGTIQPISEIAGITKEKDIPLHTDAVQAVGKIPVDVDDLGVDLLTLSAHKMYGPKGIGALYVRKGTRISSLIHGGHHERHRRAGTENVAGIVGLARAMKLAVEEIPDTAPRLAKLRDHLQNAIQEKISHTRLNGHPEKRLPHILNMSFEFIEGESILLTLDIEGVAVSTGSACTSGSLETSHVLSAMNVDPVAAQGSVRFSLGKDNTKEEMDYVADSLVPIVTRLREMSPLWNK